MPPPLNENLLSGSISSTVGEVLQQCAESFAAVVSVMRLCGIYSVAHATASTCDGSPIYRTLASSCHHVKEGCFIAEVKIVGRIVDTLVLNIY